MTKKADFIEKNTMLIREFDKYVLENPQFSDAIPDNALLVMQIDGDEEFNQWAREMAEATGDNEHTRVYVTITEFMPVRSRIGKLKIEKAA